MKSRCFPVVRVGEFALASLLTFGAVFGQVPAAQRISPNLENNIDRPLRYRPDGRDFLIQNGAEFFNRPLYGGNTAFRVDGGDKPEFVLYLPGRGGNLRIGMRAATGARWLQDAEQIVTRYRPGELLYEIRDPLLGRDGVLRLSVVATHQVEGFIVCAERAGSARDIELIWAYGGVNGQRGVRDGDIGTERVPISEWFQLKPEFCRGNQLSFDDGFTLTATAATIAGVMPAGARLGSGDATCWNDPVALLASQERPAELVVAVGHVVIPVGHPMFLGLQRVPRKTDDATELGTYLEVKGEKPEPPGTRAPPPVAVKFTPENLPSVFDEAERHFADLRARVEVDTPDPFINAAVGALNVAADAVWDEPQGAIMHGAIAWRTRLLGWRGPYSLDALGWPERAKKHFIYWAGRQNANPVPAATPPPDEKTNLARNEAGLHTNGDLSNSHYDMNLVFVDALFRHLRWTGDLELARQMWPVIERHLAWERRLFRREFGPEKLPLYEGYAAIWASDDLEYGGGGAAHASAYNYWHNTMAAQLAKHLGVDPTPFEKEAQLIARAMRELLWMQDRGMFAEFKDLQGLQRVHPSAALWTFYHTMDAELPTAAESALMARYVNTELPHLPVKGEGVPAGLFTVATSDWMPYSWSINNVTMNEAIHGALGLWQAGDVAEAFQLMKGALLASMFMGICPGNVGSMNYLDVYRRESQRDFADPSGVLSRATIEGLFGVKPDALAGTLMIAPGFPAPWTHASLKHPNVSLTYRRETDVETYTVEQRFAAPLNVRLRAMAQRAHVAKVTLDGRVLEGSWKEVNGRVEIAAPAAKRSVIAITCSGDERTTAPAAPRAPASRKAAAVSAAYFTAEAGTKVRHEMVDLTPVFNDRVTQIFKHEYRSPRSPFVSLAIPKQGIGAWAGHVNEMAQIDDAGLRRVAAANGGRLVLPNGVPLAIASSGDAKNIVFTSQWDNFPPEITVPLSGRARQIYLLMAGSTNHMQSRIDNGEAIVTYVDGTTARLALENPTTWWPIDQDYFIDDFQFARPGPLPIRVDLATGKVRVLVPDEFKGKGGKISGGAATILTLPLRPDIELRSLTLRTLSNEVVIGLMAATLSRPASTEHK